MEDAFTVNAVESTKAIIRDLSSANKTTYDKIAQYAQLNLSSVKQFMTVDSAKISKNNHTLRKISVLITKPEFLAKFSDVSESHSEELTNIRMYLASATNNSIDHSSPEYEALVDLAYDLINKILGGRFAPANADFQKLAGTYTCYRAGATPNRVTCSSVEFKLRPSGLWQFEHLKTDRFGERTKVDGPVVILGDYLYLFGDINKGKGVEFLVLKLPEAEEFKTIVGMITTRSDSRRPVMSRTILVRSAPPNIGVYTHSTLETVVPSYLLTQVTELLKNGTTTIKGLTIEEGISE